MLNNVGDADCRRRPRARRFAHHRTCCLVRGGDGDEKTGGPSHHAPTPSHIRGRAACGSGGYRQIPAPIQAHHPVLGE